MMKAITSSNNGFTLIEVAASLVIIGVSLVALLQTMSLGSIAFRVNEDMFLAAHILEKKVEEIKCKPFSFDVSDAGVDGTYTNFGYTVTETVNWLGNQFLKRVVVTVNWTAPFGGSKSDSMAFLVADR